MRKHRHPFRVALLAIPALLGASCGSTAMGPHGNASRSGSLTVLAAASLSEAFAEANNPFETRNPGLLIHYSFAGSQQLVTSIRNGAPADVVATADMNTMRKLVVAGLVETPQALARNALEIVVAKGNPKRIDGLARLGDPGVAVVLADPSVPVGNLAQQVLRGAGIAVTPKSYELDVKATLEKVESGDADAAIVYRTDVAAASGRVSGVVIPDSQNVLTTYPIAIVKATRQRDEAARLVQDAVAGGVQAVLRNRGFLAP